MPDAGLPPLRVRILLNGHVSEIMRMTNLRTSDPRMPSLAGGSDAATMIFEFERLNDVCMHETELEKKFLGDLLALAPQTLARISSLVAAGDAPEVHASAHALKGHCLMLGANALGHVFGELERDAGRGHLTRGRELVARAEIELSRVRTLLEAYLGALPRQ